MRHTRTPNEKRESTPVGKLLWLLCLILWGCSSLPVEKPVVPEPIRRTPLPLAIAHAPMESAEPEVANDGTIVSPTPAPSRVPERKPQVKAPVATRTPSTKAPPKIASQPTYPKTYPKAPRKPIREPQPLAEPPPLPASSSLSKAEAASLRLDELISQGVLQANYVGTGQHEMMVTFSLRNTSNKEVTVELTPGMILNPGKDHKVQPLLVDEQSSVTLAPGESRSGDLFSYCMDSRVPAPQYYEPVNYRFATRTKDGGPEAVLVMEAAKALLPAGPHRRAVTQLAIWKSLGQRIGDSQISAATEAYPFDPQARQTILRDVDRVINKAFQR